MDPEQNPSSHSPVDTQKSDYAKSALSPKNIIIYLIAAVLVYGGIYYFFVSKKGGSSEQTTLQQSSNIGQQPASTSGAEAGSQLVFELKAQNNSQEDGLAIFSEENGQTKVEVSVVSTSTEPQPAHIHVGSCPNPGAVKWPLTSVVKGSSLTTIGVPLTEIKKMLPLAVNVHKSESGLTTYVSCGDIK